MNHRRRLSSAGIAALLASIMLVGCATPQPEPTPTPTGFADEEAAYAAAEETYSEFTSRYNAKYSGDKETNTQELLTGAALEADIRVAEYEQQNDLRIDGYFDIISFTPVEAMLGEHSTSVTLRICTDPSNARVVGSDGEIVDTGVDTSPYALNVEFITVDGALRIASSDETEDPTCE